MSAVCGACNGSGHYDNDGAPPCGACNGTGEADADDLKYELQEVEKQRDELLAALQDLLSMRDGPDSYVGDASLAIEVIRARAAIKRATGGEP